MTQESNLTGDSDAIHVIQVKKDLVQSFTIDPNSQSKTKTRFTLGPLNFASKGKAKEFVGKWLANSYENYLLDQNEKDWVYALIEMHPNKIEKLNNHTGNIMVRKNPYNSKYFNFVIQKNPPDEDTLFSYLVCFNPNMRIDHLAHCKMAFRCEIQPQTLACRMDYFFDHNTVICPHSNMVLYNDANTHIDHHKFTFNSIFDAFLKMKKLDCKDIQLSYVNGQDYFIKNSQLKKEWYDFHEQHAILLPVFKKWNLTHNQKEKQVFDPLEKVSDSQKNQMKYKFMDEE